MKNAQNTQKEANNHQQIEDNDLLIAIYGKENFLKVYQALEIGKIRFSFVPKNEPKNSIDCFVNADDFVSDLIDLIDSRDLVRLANAARAKQANEGKKYADIIWESKAGLAANEENAIIRKFTIQPGTSQEFAFRATQGEKSIIVGFSFKDLKLLSYRWHFLEKDWNAIMAEKYNMDAMMNQYRAKKNKEQYEAQMKEAEEGDLPINQDTTAQPVSKSEESSDYGVTTDELDSMEDELPVPEPTPIEKDEEPAPEKMTEEVKPKADTKKAQKEAPKAKPEATKAPSANETTQTMSLKIKNVLVSIKNGGKAFQGYDEKNNLFSVIIRPDRLANLDAEIARVMDESSKLGNKVTFKVAAVNGDRVYVA